MNMFILSIIALFYSFPAWAQSAAGGDPISGAQADVDYAQWQLVQQQDMYEEKLKAAQEIIVQQRRQLELEVYPPNQQNYAPLPR